MSYEEQVTAMEEAFSQALLAAETAEDLRRLERSFLHVKKGRVRELTRGSALAGLDVEARRSRGVEVARIEQAMRERLEERLESLTVSDQETTPGVGIDFSLPAGIQPGSVQPVMVVQAALEDIFRGMGFRVDEGFEVETEYFNFDAVNVGPDHPARDMQDTFWLENGLVLRTHTSASQVRALRAYGAPLRVIFPGRCFRQEETDASHETSFYQCEGLMVDKGVSVANLLGVMRTLLSEVFEREVKVRLRPGYFPFVEPGFELDLRCLICDGTGCKVCKQSGWVELMPCGMVHPKVLEAGGIPEGFSGFAFGLGMTRLAMMKFGIPDIRLFDSGDLRFHSQFPVSA